MRNKITMLSHTLIGFFWIALIANLVAFAAFHFFLTPEQTLSLHDIKLSTQIRGVPASMRQSVMFWDAYVGLPSAIITSLIYFLLAKLFAHYAKFNFSHWKTAKSCKI